MTRTRTETSLAPGHDCRRSIAAPASLRVLAQDPVQLPQLEIRIAPVRVRVGRPVLRLYVPAGVTIARRALGARRRAADPPAVALWPAVSIATDRWEDDGGAAGLPAAVRTTWLNGTDAVSGRLIERPN